MSEPITVAPGRMTAADIAQAASSGTPQGKVTAAEAIAEVLRLYGMSPDGVSPEPEPLITEEIPSLVGAPGARLDQLTALYAEVKPQADALAKKLKEITDAIKVEALVGMAAVGASDAVIIRTPSLSKPLQFSSYEKTTVRGADLKSEAPEVYAKIAKTTTVWTLRAVSG